MIIHTTPIRVRYAETDQMKFVYYAHYAVYFETARVELIRSLGVVYDQIEKSGTGFPVLELHVKFIRPAYYDELLLVKTLLKKIPSTRITLEYEITNAGGKMLTVGRTTLAFVNLNTMKPVSCPPVLLNAIKKHWKK